MERDYLLEIGCEEIPAGFVGPALWFGGQQFDEMLKKARLSFDRVDIYGTPRRLTYIVRNLSDRQETSEETVLGPPKSVAFDREGNPTKAALGFAKAQGVDVSALQVFPTTRGEYLGIKKALRPRPVSEVLSELVSAWIPAIPFKKTMRWADLDVRFARPVHWIVSLYGEEVIPISFGNVTAGKTTFGHRFLSPGAIVLSSPAGYFDKLAAADVFVDLEVRKEKIRAGIKEAEARIGRKWVEDEPLVETVANLVEYPVVLVGRFPEKYLALPREILITSMRVNQKYFVFEDDRGNLFPGFAFVSNMRVPDNRVVITGNERVLRARLSDAEFYYGDDLKKPLFDRAQALKNVLFQADLGMYWEKIERMTEIAGYVASIGFPAKEKDCRRAAVLTKADLTTGVIKEFPELQGVMGRHYALKTGEKEEVAQAVFEHYLPKGQSDELPATDVGVAVAIADKIDMVCGCFGVGLIPTGTADPYGLRRHTLGILSILETKGLRVPVEGLVDRSLATLSGKLKSPAAEVKRKAMEFIGGRLFNLWTSQGTPGDLADAVISAGLTDMVDLRAKMNALVVFRSEAAFEPLAEVFKRAINITKAYTGPLAVSEALFEHDEERVLHKAAGEVSGRVASAAKSGKYGEAFGEMARLQPLVSAFFEKVLVMAKDEKVKNNRLALLKNLSSMFAGVADFSKVSAAQPK
ncbi:MAG: glycine--tRNA ligase subunit beta [Deltaproteobacteria bacterium RBG_16_64_85]|nr:MAG: glycine--tRNA ligase subunit beta [Deltaproteobacteria bacterium RBG_16_64_85]